MLTIGVQWKMAVSASWGAVTRQAALNIAELVTRRALWISLDLKRPLKCLSSYPWKWTLGMCSSFTVTFGTPVTKMTVICAAMLSSCQSISAWMTPSSSTTAPTTILSTWLTILVCKLSLNGSLLSNKPHPFTEILKCNRYDSTEEKGWANPDEDKSHAFLDKKKWIHLRSLSTSHSSQDLNRD